MRGQRKPTKMKILEGEPNKKRINYKEPTPEGKTTNPKFLNHWAKNEWKRIVPELDRLGLLTLIDRASLAAYCQSYGRWVQAENKLNKLIAEAEKDNKDPASAFFVGNKYGGLSKNPLLTIINECLSQMHEYLTEFGMTPVSRSRITTQPDPDKVDPMEELLSKKPADYPMSER